MTNFIKTNCPFTLNEYTSLLKLAKSRFTSVGYTDFGNLDSFVIWRHDVEYNVDQMDILAKLDHSQGIRSTLFIQLHSNHYNFWDKENIAVFRNWTKIGHDIGLHFDCSFYGNEVFKNIEEHIAYEASFMERELKTEIRSFSYHNPNSESLKYKENYAGLVNAYNPQLFGSDIHYVSDSNGRWREKTIRDLLEDESVKKVQVNTHDTWWTEDRIPQFDKLKNAIRANAEKQIAQHESIANIVVKDII